VAGRAGRGDRAGEVVVQTFSPQAEAIQFARQADFNGFAAAELEVRRQFGYPPARHLIRHLFRSPSPDKLKFFTEQWAKRVREALGNRVELRGPVPAPIEKIRDEYRWQLWYFVGSVTKVIGDLTALRDAFEWPEDLTQILDIDPMNLV
jgi:primosomal protein N' (replication factor Y) (superfamily II helicase)